MILGYWQSFIRSWEKHFGLQLATLTILTSTFTGIVLFYLVHKNLDAVLEHWGKDVRMSLYLEDDFSQEKVKSLTEKIKKLQGVLGVKHLSKSEAKDRFTKRMQNIAPDIFGPNGSDNPLPSSLEIQFDLNQVAGKLSDQFSKFSATFLAWDGVDDVTFGHDWTKNYAAVINYIGAARWTLSFLMLLACLLVVGNSIRNSIAQRKVEVEVLELVGATKWMIVKPYLFEGGFMGLLSQGLALIIGYTIFYWQMSFVTSEFLFNELGTVLSFLDLGDILTLFIVSGLFGTLGSLLCVWNISTGWSAAQKVQGNEYGV